MNHRVEFLCDFLKCRFEAYVFLKNLDFSPYRHVSLQKFFSTRKIEVFVVKKSSRWNPDRPKF